MAETPLMRMIDEGVVDADDIFTPEVGLLATQSGAMMLPGSGILDAAGYAFDMPSIGENIYQGNFGDAALQGAGLLGDMMYAAAPFTAGMTVAPAVALKGMRAAKVADPLVVMHNIHEQPLRDASRRGGIPVPSLAIVKADDPLTKFGELSLIGTPSMAKPGARNPVYKGDAYTVRQPRVETVPDETSIEFVKDKYGFTLDKVGYYDPDDLAEAILSEDIGYFTKPLGLAYLSQKGVDFGDLKGYELEKFVRDKVQSDPEFYRWFAKQREDMIAAGGGFTERIFRGYTPSGNRRYAEATLPNLVREMRGKGRGAEGLTGTFGSMRAKVTEKFGSLDEIKSSRGLLGSVETEEYGDMLGDAQNLYFDMLGSIARTTGLSDDGAADVLEYIMIGGDRQLTNFAKEYADDIIENSPYIKRDADELRERMRSLPTQYFEAKPDRAVSLSEFKGAIVPSNVDQSTILALEEAGITDIKYYDTQDERAKLVKKFGDQFFTLPVGLLAGGAVVGSGLLQDDPTVQEVY